MTVAYTQAKIRDLTIVEESLHDSRNLLQMAGIRHDVDLCLAIDYVLWAIQLVNNKRFVLEHDLALSDGVRPELEEARPAKVITDVILEMKEALEGDNGICAEHAERWVVELQSIQGRIHQNTP